MRRRSPEHLEQAFERAARVASTTDAALQDAQVAWAYAVLSARRVGLAAEVCPSAVRRRTEAFALGQPRGVVGRLLALVFDSGATALPASRSAVAAPRTLRYALGDATVDVQMRTAVGGGRTLHVAVSPPQPGLEFIVQALPRGPRRRTELDRSGMGRVSLPGRSTSACAYVRVAGDEAFRIAELPLA